MPGLTIYCPAYKYSLLLDRLLAIQHIMRCKPYSVYILDVMKDFAFSSGETGRLPRGKGPLSEKSLEIIVSFLVGAQKAVYYISHVFFFNMPSILFVNIPVYSIFKRRPVADKTGVFANHFACQGS